MSARTKIAIGVLSAAVLAGIAVAAALYRHAANPPAPAAPPTKLTIAANLTYIGTGLVLIATANNYFEAEGLGVTLLPYTSGQAALESALAGEAQFATAAETPLMFATMAGRPVLLVATIASQIRDRGLVARKDRGIIAPADLEGKRIGVTMHTSAQFMLDAYLDFHRIASSKVRVVNLKPEELSSAL